MPKSANVGVGKPQTTGAVWTATAGTALPTKGSDQLNEAFKELGYANEDGLVNAFEEDVEDIKAWGGDVVATVSTESTETFAITMIETNELVAKEFYGSENVETTDDGEIVIKSNANEKVAHPWVFETLLGADRKERIVVPNGKVSELGEVEYVDGSPVGYPMTIKALPDEQGNRAYRYISKAKEAV